MAAVSSNTLLNISIFFSIPLLYFYRFLKIKFLLKFKPNFVGCVKLFYFKISEIKYILFFLLLTVFTSKNTNEDILLYKPTLNLIYLFTCILLLLICLLLYFVRNCSDNVELDNLFGISVWFFLCLSSFFFTKDFINLLFNLELIATIYFFFFLNFFQNSYVTLIKFKNLLSNYLFVSFFTLMLFCISIVFITKNLGTISFYELKFLYNQLNFIIQLSLLTAFFWKLGAPGFYFFKLEIYKFLPTYSLIFFSVINFVLTTFVFLFFFLQCYYFYNSCNISILVIILYYNILLLLRGINLDSLSQFLGLSAINSWSIILIMCLI